MNDTITQFPDNVLVDELKKRGYEVFKWDMSGLERFEPCENFIAKVYGEKEQSLETLHQMEQKGA